MNLTYSELKKQVLACKTPAKAYAAYISLWPEFQESLAAIFKEQIEDALFTPTDLVTMTGLSFTQISHSYTKFTLRVIEAKAICYALLRTSVHAFVTGEEVPPPLTRDLQLLSDCLETVSDEQTLRDILDALEAQAKETEPMSEQQLLLARIQECAWEDFDMAWTKLGCVSSYRRLVREGPDGKTNWLLKFPIYLSIIMDRPIDYFITQGYLDPLGSYTPHRDRKALKVEDLRQEIIKAVLYLSETEKAQTIADIVAKYGGDRP